MLDLVIVGSGFSGIYSLKNCIYEGLNAIVLEKSENLGGVWNIKNKPGGVHNFTYSVTSKLYLSSTDFPPPSDWPEFPHSSKVYKYLMDYVAHFKLKDYIQTNTEVINIQKYKDHWEILTKNNKIFKSKKLIIATGVNMCPYYPESKLFDNFIGTKIHSHYYDESVKKLCEGKRVLIVGGSDTACDIASDISKTAERIYVSIKDGQWFQSRINGAYEPADMLYSRSVDYIIKNIIGKSYIDKNFSNAKEPHTVYYWWGEGGSGIDIWKPKCEYLNSYYNKSRDIINLVALGAVIPCGKIQNITNNLVECEGVNYSMYIDVIIFATGYKSINCMKFIDKYVKIPRYKLVFPIHKNNIDNINGSIAFIGYIRPYLTSIPMMIEFQSRMVSKIFSNKIKLANDEELLKIIDIDMEKQKKEFPCNAERLPFLVDPYDYTNSIATIIDAHPNYWKIFWTDPILFNYLAFDSWNHFAYRLNDPDEKLRKLARKMIFEYHHNKISLKLRLFQFGYLLKYTFILIYIIIFIILLYLSTRRCPIIK
jgi:dimethylaniline monooxygenase (N-oxide forming)